MSDRQMPTVTARFDRNPLNVKRAAVCHLVVEVTAPKTSATGTPPAASGVWRMIT